MDGHVIAAFPATGKTHFATRNPGVIDSDSSKFSWRIDPDTFVNGLGARERHPDWPANYMAHIERLLTHAVSLVLVSTHEEVRAALAKHRIPFTLVYPAVELRDEYRERMQRRGSPQVLIAKVIDELWDDALASCAAQEGCEHITLGPGMYLGDALTPGATGGWRPVSLSGASTEMTEQERSPE